MGKAGYKAGESGDKLDVSASLCLSPLENNDYCFILTSQALFKFFFWPILFQKHKGILGSIVQAKPSSQYTHPHRKIERSKS